MSMGLSTGFLGLSQKENPARAWLLPNSVYGLNATGGWALVDGKIVPYDDEAGRPGRRNSKAWEINAAGELIEFAIDEPRRTAAGDVIEPASTNLFLNSTSPATQTVTLATGDNTLTVWGSGSVQIAANTATGTGFGTATDGSPVTVNITGAGSVDCTVAGSPTIVNLEAGSGTSPIVTAGSSVTRAADTLVATQGSGSDPFPGFTSSGMGTAGWALAKVHIADNNTAYQQILSIDGGTTANRFSIARHLGNGRRIRLDVWSGGVQQATNINLGDAASEEALIAITWGPGVFRACLDRGTVWEASPASLPIGLNGFRVGNRNSPADAGTILNGAVSKVLTGSGTLTDAELQAL